MCNFKIEINEGKASIYTPYNPTFVEKIRNIEGSKWNGKAWIVSENLIPFVREIMLDVYGENDISHTKKIDLKLTFEHCYEIGWGHSQIVMFGKILCYTTGYETARCGEGVIYVKGKPCNNGSRKHNKAGIKEGSVIVLNDIPESLYLKEYENHSENCEVEVIKKDYSKEEILKEKENLLKRLEEIEILLNGKD